MYSTPFHTTSINHLTFLVTGGGGFIGSNLVEYLLLHGAGSVRVLDNFSTGFRQNLLPFAGNPALEVVEGDICDLATCLAACEGVDIVLHQAALGSVPRSIHNPAMSNEVNVSGFVNMLTAAKDQKVKRVVYASSSSVYGDSVTLPKVETQVGNPLTPYAVAKRANELYADVFAKTYGMEIIGLRYFNIFGNRQSPEAEYAGVIPLFMEALLQGRAPQINGDGLQTRDFTYIENCVQANIKAALVQNPKALNQVYNIATGVRSKLLEVYQIIGKAAGVQQEPHFKPARIGDIKDSLADISKARALLGYNPQVSMPEGLQRTFKWFKLQKQLLEQAH
ncbi:SDR family oxidoreductase [Pontibacter qinzhouensis]|uniref:SDR family oxidoreductase n=1 Tax=Pontibacter qinzhouensis TaxID=2603253 RepID=A0A5C8KEA5_9BACT|nr:SDR family oxidoreductase [Pontibacter qinzhouensis]TXK52868.1 SDR family oxidoreductase [Pontibacter qinzhouensis]